MGRRSGVGGPLLVVGLLGVLIGAAPRLEAIPLLDLKAYPAAAAGERRWVIQLPGLLPPSRDPALSADPSDWRVQLIVGRTLPLDCNQHRLGGRLRPETLPGTGLSVFRFTDAGPLLSTRRACPPGEPLQPRFVTAGSKPFVVPYNASQPIVVYTPADYEVRWRIWKAERQTRPASQR